MANIPMKPDNQKLFGALIQELKPETVVWKTMSKVWTAGEMAVEMDNGSQIARQYFTELLRISRDILAQRSK